MHENTYIPFPNENRRRICRGIKTQLYKHCHSKLLDGLQRVGVTEDYCKISFFIVQTLCTTKYYVDTSNMYI